YIDYETIPYESGSFVAVTKPRVGDPQTVMVDKWDQAVIMKLQPDGTITVDYVTLSSSSVEYLTQLATDVFGTLLRGASILQKVPDFASIGGSSYGIYAAAPGSLGGIAAPTAAVFNPDYIPPTQTPKAPTVDFIPPPLPPTVLPPPPLPVPLVSPT